MQDVHLQFMNQKEFAQLAIKNGFTNDLCAGLERRPYNETIRNR